MDGSQDAPPLTTLPENTSLDDESASFDQANPPAASAFAGHDLFFPNRRRRFLSHRSLRFGGDTRASSSRNSQSFNPEAAEFVPVAKMPSKRKASSSARSGKTVMSAPRSGSANPDMPIIRSEDLFGKDGLPRTDSEAPETGGLLTDDDETHSDILELEMQDLRALAQTNAQNPQGNAETIRDALTLARSRTADRSRPADLIKRGADNTQSSSAILFSCDQATGSSDTTGDLHRLHYLPLCPTTTFASKGSIAKDTNLTIIPSYRHRIDNATLTPTSSKAKWPLDEIPKELFDLITDYLSRDEVKSMRMVCREFERKVSCTLFNSSVVPFNTELYDMIDEDAKVSTRTSYTNTRSMGKGKARARDAPNLGIETPHTGLHWQNAKDDAEGKVYRGHGLRVFQGFGPHIKRFGMSFEVAEEQLSRPPVKRELDLVESYHGAYDWPPQQYTRFANLAGLERTADETLRMKAAFSNLKKVQELGLAVESGLGWLNGPDKSIRARIFERPSAVFGQSRNTVDRQTQEAKDFWLALQACHRSVGVTANSKEISLARKVHTKPVSDLPGLQGSRYADPKLWPSIASGNAMPATSSGWASEEVRHGVLYTTFNNPELATSYDKSALMPSELRKEQKEWLLETEWAQRAFLECYMLAIIDNPVIVANVKTLNIAKISSGFLPVLATQSFWDALPNLTDVTIHVKPDWRSVEKDNAGFAETRCHSPSEAVRLFHRCILRDRVCLRPSITKLNVGWVGGGEHAEGIFARNNNLLPAPIVQPEHSIAAAAGFGLAFQFVEHLTLTNCWITPPMLEELVNTHSDKSLKTLTLDSVSLTTHPRFPAGGQPAQQQHVAQAMAALQAGGLQVPANLQNMLLQQGQLAGQLAAQPAGGAPLAPHQMAQQILQQAQQVGAGWQMPIPNALQQQMNQQFLNNNNINPGGNPNANPAFPAIVPALNQNQGGAAPNINMAQNPPVPSHWSDGHREGSWPELLNKISPGPIFTDFLPQPQPWEEQLPPRPETKLQTIELKSCGYARLTNNSTFDQFAIQITDDHHLSVWFRTRQTALAPAMMTTHDRFIGRIVQHIPQRELDALLFAWGLTDGWEDAEKAEAVEYDGLLAGGTGRFSGKIDKATTAQPNNTSA